MNICKEQACCLPESRIISFLRRKHLSENMTTMAGQVFAKLWYRKQKYRQFIGRNMRMGRIVTEICLISWKEKQRKMGWNPLTYPAILDLTARKRRSAFVYSDSDSRNIYRIFYGKKCVCTTDLLHL